MMKKIIFLAFALVVVGWGQAFADYSFDYASNDNSINISGMLITATNGAGDLPVTGGSFTGTFLGSPISATLFTGYGSATPPVALTSPSGAFWYDNMLSPGKTPMLTLNGLLFTVGTYNNAGYIEINIYGNSADGDYSYYEWTPAGGYTVVDKRGTFTASSVPIPAAAWLLGTGLIGLVAIRRRMKK